MDSLGRFPLRFLAVGGRERLYSSDEECSSVDELGYLSRSRTEKKQNIIAHYDSLNFRMICNYFVSYLNKQISSLFCTFQGLKSIHKRNDNMNLVGPCTYIMIIGDTFHKCNITVSSSCLFIFQSFV